MVECVNVFGYIEENAYFYIDKNSKHCFLIDPGSEGNKLLEIANNNNWIIDKILITHGHFDHIGGIKEIRDKINVEVYSYSKEYLESPYNNLSKFLGGEEIIVKNTKQFKEGDKLYLNDSSELCLEVIYTPGHTSDSVCFLDRKNKVLFSGDTIFKDSFGNTSYPGGDYNTLINSIKNKILVLDKDIKIYSGHSDETTIEDEIKNFEV